MSYKWIWKKFLNLIKSLKFLFYFMFLSNKFLFIEKWFDKIKILVINSLCFLKNEINNELNSYLNGMTSILRFSTFLYRMQWINLHLFSYLIIFMKLITFSKLLNLHNYDRYKYGFNFFYIKFNPWKGKLQQ